MLSFSILNALSSFSVTSLDFGGALKMK